MARRETDNAGDSASWSFAIGSVKGIPLRLHASLLLLLAWVAFERSEDGGMLRELLFVVSLLGCVLLHELGHALAALRFGIATRDITLYPFGGIASITAEPKPKPELVIALAGPAVNFTIAAAIYLAGGVDVAAATETGRRFSQDLFAVNVALGLFNLLPALPMDGGRVLRASLALLGAERATFFAARVGQALSFALAIVAALNRNPILLLVAIIVLSAATGEYLRERIRWAARPYLVSDVMTEARHLRAFSHATSLREATQTALTSLQTVFPVAHESRILGVVRRADLVHHSIVNKENAYLAEYVEREIPALPPEQRLTDVLPLLWGRTEEAFLVMKEGELVGMLMRERVLEFLALRDHASRTDPACIDNDRGSA